ncbi:MAG: lytic transglycosylase domain-containing protein [Candidatus Hydrogenedentes bacterium]|nr:lytic transglycosylase domain-containing protein [Candidatus Hydrogenedentota bacterium]
MRFFVFLAVSCLAALPALAETSPPGAALFLQGDEAERAGRLGDALKAYTACAAADERLMPFAANRAARVRARSGDVEGAATQWRAVLEGFPEGPWTRLAQCRYAEFLAGRGRRAEAAALFDRALKVSPRPWFLDEWAWAAAENLLADTATRAGALPFLRETVETIILLEPRKKAARLLLQFSDPADRALGVWGLLRSGAMDEARPVLEAEPVMFGDESGGEITLQVLTALAVPAATAPDQVPAQVRVLARQNTGNPWMRVWLLYALRLSAARKAWAAADLFADTLSSEYGDRRDGGDALYWYAGHAQSAKRSAEAVALYRKLAERHPGHARASDALFAAGRIRMGEKSWQDALLLLTEAAGLFKSAALRAEAWHLCAEIAGHCGDVAGRKRYLTRAVAAGPGSYYAHRSLARLGKEGGGLSLPGGDPGSLLVAVLPGTALAAPAALPPARGRELDRLRFFGSHGLEEGEWEALALILSPPSEAGQEAAWYDAVARAGFMYTVQQTAGGGKWETGDEAPSPLRRRVEYPLAYWDIAERAAREAGVDPLLLLAISRQESTFRSAIVSRSGAVGVMQLMPSTAKWLAGKEPRLAKETGEHLSAPENSLRLGAHYLRRMLDRSGGNLVYALASYNGGPGNCDKWRARFPGGDMDGFIESMDFAETRDYVRRVLANYAAYRGFYPDAARGG